MSFVIGVARAVAGAKGVTTNEPTALLTAVIAVSVESKIDEILASSSSIFVVSVPPSTQGYERLSPSFAVTT